MRTFLRQSGYLLAILVLLPYIITIFANGNGMEVNSDGNSPYVTVSLDEDTRKMPLDEYAIGVLAKEIDGAAGEEAVKAQAVLIRTSIYKTLQENGTDAVLDKRYWSRSQMEDNWGSSHYGEYYEKMKNAWEETKGQVLMYEGSLILTPYHRLSNGKTRSGNEVFESDQYPYLTVKDCPADREAEDAMTTTMIQGTNMEVLTTDSAGYVTEVRCGEETVSGEEFRDTYHLTSACFTLQESDGQTRVTCTGIGHGLGMSQYTAAYMAEEGSSYEEILAYFYEGTSLEEVAEILVKPE